MNGHLFVHGTLIQATRAARIGITKRARIAAAGHHPGTAAMPGCLYDLRKAAKTPRQPAAGQRDWVRADAKNAGSTRHETIFVGNSDGSMRPPDQPAPGAF